MKELTKALKLFSYDMDNIIEAATSDWMEDQLISDAMMTINQPAKYIKDSYQSILLYYALILIHSVQLEEFEISSKLKKVMDIEFNQMLYKINWRIDYRCTDEDVELYNEMKSIYDDLREFIIDEQSKSLK